MSDEMQALGMVDYFMRAGKVAAPVGMVGGIMADMATPLAPFSFYLAIIFLVIAVVSGIIWFSRDKKVLKTELKTGRISVKDFREATSVNKWAVTFSFSTIVMVVMFVMVALGADADDNRGFLASQVEALQKIQDSLFDIKKNVEVVKQDVKVVQKDVKSVQQDVKDIKQISEKIATGVEEVKKLGGVIAQPKTAQDFLHNARILENSDQTGKARQAYEKYISFNEKFLDPHESYQAILRHQDGISQARRIYRKLADDHPTNSSLALAYSYLLEDQDRKPYLLEMRKNHSQFTPLYAELAFVSSYGFSSANSTFADRRQEIQFLELFEKHNKISPLSDYYLDKTKAQKIQNERLKSLHDFRTSPNWKTLRNPVNVIGQEGNDKIFTVTMTILEPTIEIWYRLESMQEFQSTGFLSFNNQMTGKPQPNVFFMTPNLRVGKNKIWIKYKDSKEDIIGPLEFTMEIKPQALERAKMFIQYQWPLPIMKKLKVRYYREWVYLIQMAVSGNKELMEQVSYSFGEPKLDKHFIQNYKEVQPFQLKDMAEGKYELYIQFTLADGWKSPVLHYSIQLTRDGQWCDYDPK